MAGNRKLASAARAAIHDPLVEDKKGFCSRFVRQTVAKAYGTDFASLFGASAIISGNNFVNAGMGFTPEEAGPLQLGDILYKMQGSGGFGHVGIFVGNSQVAENSSTRIGRINGAKGYRSLKQYGPYQVVGRIPEEEEKRPAPFALYHEGRKLGVLTIREGRGYYDVSDFAEAIDAELDFDPNEKQVLINGQVLDMQHVRIEEGNSTAWIEELAEKAGLEVRKSGRKVELVKG